jgi:zinc protease
MEREIDTSDAKATVMLFFPACDGFDAARRRNLSFLGTVVNDRVRLEVRERLGASYSPGATASSSTIMHGIGAVLIQAAGDPSAKDELVAACMSVAEDLAANGVTEEEVSRLSEPLLNQIRDQMRTNGFWLGALEQAQSDPESLADVRSLEAFYGSIDPVALTALAKEYLQPERASVLVVLPLSAAEKEAEEVVEEVVEEAASGE